MQKYFLLTYRFVLVSSVIHVFHFLPPHGGSSASIPLCLSMSPSSCLHLVSRATAEETNGNSLILVNNLISAISPSTTSHLSPSWFDGNSYWLHCLRQWQRWLKINKFFDRWLFFLKKRGKNILWKLWQLQTRVWFHQDLGSLWLCLLGGPMACCCGRSSHWEVLLTQESQWKNCSSCWRRAIAWTNLPTVPTNCEWSSSKR